MSVHVEPETRKLLRGHRLRHQKPLDLIDPQLAQHDVVGPLLDTLGDCSRATRLRKLDNLSASKPPQLVVGTAVDKKAIKLDLGECKVCDLGQRRPLLPNIANRETDVVKPKRTRQFVRVRK